MQRLPGLFMTAFLMVFISAMGLAQTPSPRPVAVMPFTGEPNEADNIHFRDSVAAEIGKLEGNFPATVQRLPDGMAPEDLMPDEPPPVYMVDGKQYAVTGASYPDDTQHQLQVWLWDVEEPTLVYTDQLVCDEIPDAAEFMPLLIEWIFSHVPDPPVEEPVLETEPVAAQLVLEPVVEDTIAVPRGQRSQAAPFEDEDKWFYLGLRAGGSMRLYNMPYLADGRSALYPDGNADPNVTSADESLLSPTFEAALQASVQLLPFLSLQGEAIFTMDRTQFKLYKDSADYEAHYSYMSFMFPAVLKLTFRPIPFLIAPFGGVYYMLGLGDMQVENTLNGTADSYPYTRALPIGWIAGLNFGMQLSYIKKELRGTIFLDIRYSSDLSPLEYQQHASNQAAGQIPVSFNRRMLSLTLGYEIGLLNRDIKTKTR